MNPVCPNCRAHGEFLPSVSETARVNYYRCRQCGHVWTHEKGRVPSAPREVTIRPEKKKYA
jgi:rubredoxin